MRGEGRPRRRGRGLLPLRRGARGRALPRPRRHVAGRDDRAARLARARPAPVRRVRPRLGPPARPPRDIELQGLRARHLPRAVADEAAGRVRQVLLEVLPQGAGPGVRARRRRRRTSRAPSWRRPSPSSPASRRRGPTRARGSGRASGSRRCCGRQGRGTACSACSTVRSGARRGEPVMREFGGMIEIRGFPARFKASRQGGCTSTCAGSGGSNGRGSQTRPLPRCSKPWRRTVGTRCARRFLFAKTHPFWGY